MGKTTTNITVISQPSLEQLIENTLPTFYFLLSRTLPC
jgi:hypothetical protein